ncbi:hypothetical protein [Streptomyces sp. NBC_00847]|uniref:hypothetical protein n=1 Tax=Streptomyces sp. NBC_00847 TaxID=2975850 RepID=UPI00225E2976|nr:hypothetical protein [Streptomyces sp. NBC_00847]MCX4886046.1 hypothetical protein [Streptomyces sp. NBC_00847]
MAQFESSKYPGLILQDDKGIWARFKGGQFETTDAGVLKRLRALPEDYEVTEVKASAKSDDKGDAGAGDGK